MKVPMTSPEFQFFVCFRSVGRRPRRICQRDHRAEQAPLRFLYLQSYEARRRAVEFPPQPAGS
jgi:hypothetical protein